MSMMTPWRLGAAVWCGWLAAANPSFADKPEWAGKGRPEKAEREEQRGRSQRNEDRREFAGRYFDERHRTVVLGYYDDSYRSGHCPRGLAKKHNGCLPPGQAKKWSVGQPLPRDVVFYDLPPQVVVRLGTPPTGQKFVRVAGDILLIAVGTSMVIDAIEDLGR